MVPSVGGRLSSELLAAYSQYFSDSELAVASADVEVGFLEENRVRDFTLRMDNSWQALRSLEIGLGAEFTTNEVSYGFDRRR